MKTKKVIKGIFWHVHYDKLCEWCYNYQERVNYIKGYKPEHEVETRLRLMKPVKGKIPKEYKKACEKWDEAYKKWDEAYKKWDEACEKYFEAYKKRDEAYKKWDEACEKRDEAYKKWDEACEKRDEAYKKWDEAYKKWDEAYKKRDEAYKKWDEAYKKYLPKLQLLHKKECGCLEWNDKEVVFPKGVAKRCIEFQEEITKLQGDLKYKEDQLEASYQRGLEQGKDERKRILKIIEENKKTYGNKCCKMVLEKLKQEIEEK